MCRLKARADPRVGGQHCSLALHASLQGAAGALGLGAGRPCSGVTGPLRAGAACLQPPTPEAQQSGLRPPYHVGREDEDPLVLAAGPLRVVEQVGVVL